MSDLEEKLEGILSNPKAMEQIMSLAQSLGKGGTQPPSAAPQPAKDSAPEPPPSQDWSDGGLLGALGQIDPKLISGAMQLINQYQ